MGAFVEERKAIETRFQAQWAALGNPAQVKYENVVFTPPAASPWVALTVQRGAGAQADIGTSNPLHRFAGTIRVQVIYPRDTASRDAETLADQVAGIFRSAQFASGDSGLITCRTPYITPPRATASEIEGSNWMQLSVVTPYQLDQHF
jgi:hypothetical protein